jgi:hypothetical protein
MNVTDLAFTDAEFHATESMRIGFDAFPSE